jgi:hypothetical protein
MIPLDRIQTWIFLIVIGIHILIYMYGFYLLNLFFNLIELKDSCLEQYTTNSTALIAVPTHETALIIFQQIPHIPLNQIEWVLNYQNFIMQLIGYSMWIFFILLWSYFIIRQIYFSYLQFWNKDTLRRKQEFQEAVRQALPRSSTTSVTEEDLIFLNGNNKNIVPSLRQRSSSNKQH